MIPLYKIFLVKAKYQKDDDWFFWLGTILEYNYERERWYVHDVISRDINISEGIISTLR